MSEYEIINIEQAESQLGMQIGKHPLKVHTKDKCHGRGIPCLIHSPSEHHMRDWPLNWRADTKVMERLCPHGVGHPDPDHMAYVLSLTPEGHDCPEDPMHMEYLCGYPHLEWQSVHGCDGCCAA